MLIAFFRMNEEEKRPMHLEIARATKSEILYPLVWRNLSNRDFLRGQFDLDEVASFVKASTSRADDLFRLICAWGENNKKELEENGELVAAFTRLLGCIDVAELSQRAVDEFNDGFSHFRGNVACE